MSDDSLDVPDFPLHALYIGESPLSYWRHHLKGAICKMASRIVGAGVIMNVGNCAWWPNSLGMIGSARLHDREETLVVAVSVTVMSLVNMLSGVSSYIMVYPLPSIGQESVKHNFTWHTFFFSIITS